MQHSARNISIISEMENYGNAEWFNSSQRTSQHVAKSQNVEAAGCWRLTATV